jgi:ABC-type bacteriocin/lantibiotic exporter with double-glycine peptidase domain
MVSAKKMSPGTFVSILIITFIVMNVIFGILGSVKDMYMRCGIIKNSMTIFEDCSPSRTPYVLPPRETSGIHLQDIDFSHFNKDQKRPIFQNLNLNIRFNEVTVIVGEIGSGKSTLVNMILKYQTPQKGEIFLNGVPYSNIEHSMLRKLIVYIPQNPILLNRTVFDNITYGVENKIDRPGLEALMNKLGLNTFLKSLPNGLDTTVGVHGSRLSGGQKQIVWILKIFLINPQIVIMDEPSASVDESTKKIIRYLLEHVMINRTVIIITHDQHMLRFADRILTLAHGVVVADQRPKKDRVIQRSK